MSARCSMEQRACHSRAPRDGRRTQIVRAVSAIGCTRIARRAVAERVIRIPFVDDGLRAFEPQNVRVCGLVVHGAPSSVGRFRSATAPWWYGGALHTIGIKVFSATKARERESRGERITDWIRLHPDYEVFDKIVTQSSDAEFHCLAITLFYRPKSRRAEREVDRVH